MRFSVIILFLLVASVAFGQVSVTSSTPASSATSVPLTTTISVTFSGAVDTSISLAPGENYFTNLSTIVGQSWSTDRRTLSLSVVLQPSTVYFLLIHSVKPVAGGGFPVPYCFYWTTGMSFPSNLHSVSGSITSGGSPVSPDNAIVGLGATAFTGAPPTFGGVAVTNALGQFTIPYVSDGTWYPIAAKDANLDGQIDPGAGDPIAYGDSVKVNGANVTGFTMQFAAIKPVRFAAARDSLSARAAAILPANRELRQFYAWQVDSAGAAKEFAARYTVPGSSVITEVWMEAFGVQSNTSPGGDPWLYSSRPFAGLASAALLDSVVARAERMGGKEFRRQAPPVAGSFFSAYARLGALHNTEFGWWVSDTSQNYWGLQYTFQIQVTKDSTYSVAYKIFLANATTGQILLVTGADEKAGAPLPAAYTLGQNYPNPFNPSTTINFSIPMQSRVTIDVFNVIGQKVATLVNDVRAAGSHQAVWKAQVPSGLYFYRMEASGVDAPSQHFTQVRKMMMVK
jgi:Bacterial Ig-like domain/Secretion system C-terminal sorting domain